MHRAKKPAIVDLNHHLTCKLCKGYFIDATTIIECLHSFCRSCIVKYLQTNKYCPVCDVQIHKTKPLLNIRTDKTLQDVVYKLVPRLFQSEVQRRRNFYLSHPESKPNLDQLCDNNQHIITTDESISLTMCYYGCKESARYLRCPAAVSVGHLQKLIRAKYGLSDNHHVDILYNQDCLNSTLTLMDVAYIHSWMRKAPIELTYRIYEYTAKKPKLEVKDDVQINNNNWKEVQLRISENGEMSIIQDEALDLELVNNNNYKAEVVTVFDKNKKVTKKELSELKLIGTSGSDTETTTPCVTLTSSTQTTTVLSTLNTTKCSVSSDSGEKKPEETKETKKESEGTKSKCETPEKGVKRKHESPQTQSPKPPKQTILNHSINLHNLSNNHPLKKHSHLKTDSDPKTDEVIFSKPNTWPASPKPVTKPCYMPNKPVINVPKPSTSLAATKTNDKHTDKVQSTTCSSVTKNEVKTSTTTTTQAQPTVTSQQQPTKLIKSKPSTPIGYKTLRDPPKSWNSQIAKANINKPITDPKYEVARNAKPAKFFKMRNNLPRYLGNPASGVKPMYQVHVSPEKEKEKGAEAPPPKGGEIKKHSIVKIDPKTLKPISEKAPETSSLSNSSDLKINISSVSIFNPLKLQNSPKSERKSPKSPHSPKTIAATKVPSSSPTKRDKLNLNFTPSNPFIPNLASPTVNPNQFLYPTGPPGFPPYDPRVMAAYHNLFYGQRMPFPPPGLSMDLNQRKNFEMAGPTSPKVGGMPQPHSPQQPPLKLPTSDHLAMQSSSRTGSSSTTTTTKSSTFKNQSAPKKSSKESTGKNEKSLQNAVEKLTQNRVKEIKNEAAVNKSAEKKKEQAEKAAALQKEKQEKKEEAQEKSKSEEKDNQKKKDGETKDEKEKDKEKGISNTNGEVTIDEEKKKRDEKKVNDKDGKK